MCHVRKHNEIARRLAHFRLISQRQKLPTELIPTPYAIGANNLLEYLKTMVEYFFPFLILLFYNSCYVKFDQIFVFFCIVVNCHTPPCWVFLLFFL